MSSYEADREREAVGPDEPTAWDLWRDEQGLGYDSDSEDEFAKAVADAHFEALLENAYANYLRQSTRNLIGHIYRSSPLVGRHRIAEEASNE